MSLRIVFFGTPETAATILKELLGSEHEVRGVVTAPDRPAGRGLATKPSAVKELASSSGIPILQPETLKSESVENDLRDLDAGVFIVAAYGLILPLRVLEMARLGSINVHFSLLPKLRGAAPVQWAISNGETSTGVTIMQMDEGLDTGPILLQQEERIQHDDTTGSLLARLSQVGAATLIDALEKLEEGALQPIPQNDDLATYAPKISSQDTQIDWTRPADEIERRVRAFHPRPGAWTELGGRRLKVWSAEVVREDRNVEAGTFIVEDGRLISQTASGLLRLLEVQPEGSSRMSAEEFLRGRPSLDNKP